MQKGAVIVRLSQHATELIEALSGYTRGQVWLDGWLADQQDQHYVRVLMIPHSAVVCLQQGPPDTRLGFVQAEPGNPAT